MGVELPNRVGAQIGAVFLSYASQDAAAAQRICTALRSGGIEVWFDQSELRGGEAWDRHITKQIKECALFLAVISAHTEERSEGYFRREWRVAVERMRDMAEDRAFLLPVVIDWTPENTARVPDRFREFQWMRLPEGETLPAAVERIRGLLSPAEPIKPAQQAAAVEARADAARNGSAARGRKKPGWLRPALLVVAFVVIAGGTYVALDRFVLSKHSTLVSASAGEKSIAVLPFIDMSEKHDQEYFGDGMAEEILNLLVKIPDLKVIGRTSSFQFKGRTDDLRRIGTALGAAYVVEGSVRKAGDHVRVTAQLIDTRDGAHRWSETYDRDARDAIQVQDEIAMNLVRALQLEVAPSVLLAGRSAPSSEAYDSFLRGLHALDRLDELGFNEALADFRHALEIDPTYVPAAEGVAWALYNLADHLYVPGKPGFDDARAAAESVLRLDAQSIYAHAILGIIHVEYDFDWSAAEREFDTALKLAPHSPILLRSTAQHRIAVGQWNDAVRITDEAIAGDPLDANLYRLRSYAYLRLNRLSEAESGFRRALEISPTYAWGHYFLGLTLLTAGRLEEGLAEMQKEIIPAGADAGSVVAYMDLHRRGDAEAAFERLKPEASGNFPFGMAIAYTALSNKDAAFEWLDKAYDMRDASLWAIKGHPFFRPLETDPRYAAFLRKMNLPQ